MSSLTLALSYKDRKMKNKLKRKWKWKGKWETTKSTLCILDNSVNKRVKWDVINWNEVINSFLSMDRQTDRENRLEVRTVLKNIHWL